MMGLFQKMIVFFIFSIMAGKVVWAQGTLDTLYLQNDAILSEADEILLRGCPVLKMTEEQRNRPLPSSVNNSQTPFMSPIFSQTALECGQASSICYTLTYELNRRRNLVNDNITKRYPSHFVWNFCNNGTNRGVSFMDTWQVVRTAGTPNVAEWGGSYSTGGYARWMSGYSNYYAAMQNRIVDFCAIPTDSPDGILTLKQWLHNRLNGEEYGGLVNFYSTHVPQGHEMQKFLPEGTPCAGMYVVPSFTSSVNHSQTIVGYNDSICWDYNGDGRYTNDVDINGDGRVDVKDWEIGGVIFCNTFGTGFSNGGYCFLPYKKLAELPATGGIWNSCVYVVNVKDPVFPQITYKATIEHTCRGEIKLTAGVASNPAATEPEHTLEFNVFNYQGGVHYMQGDSTQAGLRLELGLDVSSLLNYITPNSPAKFFFNVTENDAESNSTGQIVNFSIMDYCGGLVVEQPCNQTNVPIADNAVTTLSLVRTINFTKPHIDATMPTPMEVYSPYLYDIPVTGGKAPYRWEKTKDYNIQEFTASFPTVVGNSVSLTNNDNGYAAIDIPFDFPFYGDFFNRLYIMADGYVAFRYDTYNWPFLQNADLQVKTTKMIAPFRANLIVSNVRVAMNDQEVDIAVTAKVSGQSSSNIQYVMKLYPNGVIEYYYGNMAFTGSNFLSVLSRGDSRLFQQTAVSGTTETAISQRKIRFTPPADIDFLQLSEDGILTGMSTTAFTGMPLAVTCFDNNDVRHDTILLINSEYSNLLVITNISITAGDDNIVSAGETVELDITVKNLDSIPYNDCNLSFHILSDYVTMIDSTEYFGYIAPGNEYTLNQAIRFEVDESTPHRTILDFNVRIDNDRFPVTSMEAITVYSHFIEVTDYQIIDNGNGLFDPNEIDTILVTIKNAGQELITDLSFQIYFQESDISLIQPNATIDTLFVNEEEDIRFVCRPTGNFVSGTTVDVFMDIFLNNLFYQTNVFSFVGETNCEGFENGFSEDFSFADTPWLLSDDAYTGLHSAMSGVITHVDTSTLIYTTTVVRDGNVSFNYKVSTENNYDFLNFYIDGALQGRWAGTRDWTPISFPIFAGDHILTWKYIKDVSVNGGSDRVWIDNFCLPLDNDAVPEINVTPSTIDIAMNNEVIDYPVTLESVTPIYLLFENTILDNNLNPVGWLNTDYPNGSINALESKTMNLHIDSRNLLPGIYRLKLYTEAINGNTVTTPIVITVFSNDITSYQSDNWNVNIYPNPFSSFINVSIENEDPFLPVQFELYDLFGKKLQSFTTTEKDFTMNMGNYASGVYLLRMIADNRDVEVIKIIKK